jgi:hypothetical protein
VDSICCAWFLSLISKNQHSNLINLIRFMMILAFSPVVGYIEVLLNTELLATIVTVY